MKNFEAKPCWKNIPMYANLILSKEKCQIGFFDRFAIYPGATKPLNT
jgi:hypothetical protein